MRVPNEQAIRDGQHEPEVDINDLIGEPVEPDHDLNVDEFEGGDRR